MNNSIEWLNATSSVWANRFWIATWQAVIVIAIAWLLTTLLHRLSPRVRCWIWRLAYVKILLSLFWTTPIELALLPPAIGNQESGGRSRESASDSPSPSRAAINAPDNEATTNPSDAPDARVARPESAKGVEEFDPSLTTPFAEPQGVPPSAASALQKPETDTATTPLTWQSYLLAAWLLGLVAVIAWLAIDALRAWKLLRNSQPLNDASLQHLSRDVCTRIGLRRTICLQTSPTARSPMLVRFLRPAIILPSPMVNQSSPSPSTAHSNSFPPSPLTGEGRGEGEAVQQNITSHNDLALAIAHEAAHLRRHDLTWNALAAIVHVAMYFHPLVWLAHRRIRLEQEMACDEMVLQKLSAAPHEYGRMLVNVVRNIAPGVIVAMK